MTEIISNFFSRPKNDIADSREDIPAPATTEIDSTPSDVVATDETVDTEAIATEPAEAAEQSEQADEPAAAEEDAEEDATDEAGDDAEVVAEDDPADEAEGDDEVVAEADETEESEESDEPAATEADEAEAEETEEAEPVAETEPVAEIVPVVESEPVAEQARPAAGSRGTVTVDHSVVAKVVTIVAAKIDGVHSLDADGLSVEVDGDVATIKVSLVIEFGHAIKALAEQVRIDVIEAVEQFLNFDVAAVDVHVSDIHLPSA